MFTLLSRSLLSHTAYYLVLFLSILEQVLWRGERSSLFYAPFVFYLFFLADLYRHSWHKLSFLFAALTGELLLLYFSPKSALVMYEHLLIVLLLSITSFFCWRQKRDNGEPSRRIPILFTLCFSSLLTFSLLSNLGQREYFLMAGEPAGALVYSDIWCLLAFSALILTSYRARSISSCLIVTSAALLCTYIFLESTSLDLVSSIVDREAEHRFRLGSTLLLLTTSFCVFTQQSLGIFSCKNKFFHKGDITLSILVLLGIIWLTSVSISTVRTKPCVRSLPEYQISEEMALHLFVAEDPLYYFHHGIELHGIRMAAAKFWDTGSKRFGGSSLSMQLAKVCYLPFEKTFKRKIRQAFLGVILELTYSKEDILASYLEAISYSHRAKGLREASKTYFNKTPLQLEAQEAMLLTLSIQDPYSFNPDSVDKPKIIRQREAVTRGRVRAFRPLLSQKIAHLKSIE